ncbi:MAG: SURF1 family protein [Jiangellaceae bacterium]|nr:SURF1 family protein [Jiangellaceae bacterium]
MISRRWLLRIVAGLVLVTALVRLGMWQLDRNEERAARNAAIEANAARDPVPVGAMLQVDRQAPADVEWTPVRATGRYDADQQLVVRFRPLDGQPGRHVLTPLVTQTGAALLVDRGFVPQDAEVPAPPDGEVEVVARVRLSEEGRGSGGDPVSGEIRYVDVDEIAAALRYPVYGAWAELVTQQPPASSSLRPPPAPALDAGPHLAYAVQWFLFACIAVAGFVFLARAESRLRAEPRPATVTPVRR